MPAGLDTHQRELFERLLQTGAKSSTASRPIPRRAPDCRVPLSFAQERFWFLDQLMPQSAFYVETSASEIVSHRTDARLLEQAINAVVARHEILRTAISVVDGVPCQIVLPALHLPLTVFDLAGLAPAEREREVERRVVELSSQPFDLAQPPLLRATLLVHGVDRAVFVLNLHHIVTDGGSMQVLSREVNEYYSAALAHRSPTLPDLPIQYGDFACWQRGSSESAEIEAQLAYWRDRLEALCQLDLPLDRPRPQVLAYEGSILEVQLPTKIAAGVRLFSQREQATSFMTLLAAFVAVLHFNSGQKDVAVGSPIAGRTRSELEPLIGVFLNTIILRVDLSGDPTFRELVSRVRQIAIEAFDHQEVPFERVVEALAPERDLGRNPLFQVLFQFFVAQGARTAETQAISFPVDRGTAILDLSFHLRETLTGIAGRIEYNTELFERATIERLFGQFVAILSGALVDPDVRLSQIELVSAAEREQLFGMLQGRRSEESRRATIHGRFAEQAAATPDAIALIGDQGPVTFTELEELADRYANRFMRLGLRPGGHVAICLERSVTLIAVILASLKAGAAFVPIDPANPSRRVQLIIDDCAADLVVTSTALGAPLAAACLVRVDDADEEAALAACPPLDSAVESHPLDVAYVIYTSGSTGRPKGVMGLHRATLNRFDWMIRSFPFEAGEMTCQKTVVGFVDAVWEMLGPLLAGTPLLIVEAAVARDPAALLRRIRETGVSRLLVVPSLLQALIETAAAAGVQLPNLRWWFVSGERLTQSLAERFRQEVPDGRLVNLYGSSEVAGDVTATHVDAESFGRDPPIGRPIDNCRAYVLDDLLRMVPMGAPGGLYVAGANLARGYLNQPGQTADRFLPDPFSDEAGARMYATGDRVRLRGDGNLEFLGRRDHQAKIRGYRVELGEVEAALRDDTRITQAAATVADDGAGGRLDAWVVGRADAVDVQSIRQRLAAKLPAHLVPSTITVLDSLPLTPNGKLDRLRLAALDRHDRGRHRLAEPDGPIQTALAEVWRALLKRQSIGVHDDFFAMGGHSLLATQLVSRIHERFGVELPLTAIFLHPTIAGLAARIEDILVAEVEALSEAEARRHLNQHETSVDEP